MMKLVKSPPGSKPWLVPRGVTPRTPSRAVALVGRAQEVVGLARLDAVRLAELFERRRLGRRRIEEAEQREREEAVEDVPLPGGPDDHRARLLAEEEVQVDE